jgi:hypothetical protein
MQLQHCDALIKIWNIDLASIYQACGCLLGSWRLKFLFYCHHHHHQREEERNIISCSSQLLPSNGSNSLFPHLQKRCISYSNLSDLTGQRQAKKVWFMDSRVSSSPRFNNKSWWSNQTKSSKKSVVTGFSSFLLSKIQFAFLTAKQTLWSLKQSARLSVRVSCLAKYQNGPSPQGLP